VNRLDSPLLGKVSRIERQQLVNAVNEQQRSQACIVNSFAGDLAALGKFEPTVKDVGRLMQQRELVEQGTDYVSRGCDRPTKPVRGFRARRHGPEFHEDLGAEVNGVVARKQVFHGGGGGSVLWTGVVCEAKEDVCIDEPAQS
jgi:hypothetical protein